MSRLLAWCSGATAGLVVGALLGDALRTDAELRAARRRLSRPETGASVHRSPLDGLTGENRPTDRAGFSEAVRAENLRAFEDEIAETWPTDDDSEDRP